MLCSHSLISTLWAWKFGNLQVCRGIVASLGQPLGDLHEPQAISMRPTKLPKWRRLVSRAPQVFPPPKKWIESWRYQWSQKPLKKRVLQTAFPFLGLPSPSFSDDAILHTRLHDEAFADALHGLKKPLLWWSLTPTLIGFNSLRAVSQN